MLNGGLSKHIGQFRSLVLAAESVAKRGVRVCLRVGAHADHDIGTVAVTTTTHTDTHKKRPRRVCCELTERQGSVLKTCLAAPTRGVEHEPRKVWVKVRSDAVFNAMVRPHDLNHGGSHKQRNTRAHTCHTRQTGAVHLSCFMEGCVNMRCAIASAPAAQHRATRASQTPWHPRCCLRTKSGLQAVENETPRQLA